MKKAKAFGLVALFVTGVAVGAFISSPDRTPVQHGAGGQTQTQTEVVIQTEVKEVHTLTPECKTALLKAQQVLDAANTVSQDSGEWSGLVSQAKKAIADKDILSLTDFQVKSQKLGTDTIGAFNTLGEVSTTLDEAIAKCERG